MSEAAFATADAIREGAEGYKAVAEESKRCPWKSNPDVINRLFMAVERLTKIQEDILQAMVTKGKEVPRGENK
jgi:hypothetical protein